MDHEILNQLKQFAGAFKDAHNESDTVMFLVKFFEEVLGWDSFKGEISKEVPIKDRFCDIALKIDGQIKILVECKAASIANLVSKNIEQAENYASHSGVTWVTLTNGIEWHLYHLTFMEKEGIQHDLVFRVNLIDDLETDAEAFWSQLSLLARKSVEKGTLEEFWKHKKALCKGAIVRALFNEDVLTAIRRELKKTSHVHLEMDDVFASVRDTLPKEALLEAGDISISKKKKKKHKVSKTNDAGNTVADESADGEKKGVDSEAAASPPPKDGKPKQGEKKGQI